MARHAFEGGGGNAGRANVAEQRCGGAMPLLEKETTGAANKFPKKVAAMKIFSRFF